LSTLTQSPTKRRFPLTGIFSTAGGDLVGEWASQVGVGSCTGSESPIPIRPAGVFGTGRACPVSHSSHRLRGRGRIRGPVMGLLPRSEAQERPAGGLLGRWQSRGQGFESPQLHRVDQEYRQVRSLISPLSLASCMDACGGRLTSSHWPRPEQLLNPTGRRSTSRLLARVDSGLARVERVGRTGATWASMSVCDGTGTVEAPVPTSAGA
jgi:hypothetical protein